ncbi:SirB2 family protein [Vibrio sp. ZSDZ34]|jgi:uncharacterized membrane protein SirB2|uniref:SirB2 family protein n=1 Tax=Vibrio gelatinilyticus TaxID=2893468 RepID=A0A9X2AXX5_9VIBR|nr:SirB2 family protein [Vibrio gelatinilyticus]MCJ2376048.1 SirB2 family protein [Vibrio gelatinilyticus]
MYTLLIKAHLALIVLSFISFLLRTLWGFKGSPLLENKLAFAAHKAITLTMLISALILCFMINQYPFVDAWLTEKLMLLIAYVAFAMLAFKPSITAKTRSILASVTCFLFVMIFYIAKLHTPVLLG